MDGTRLTGGGTPLVSTRDETAVLAAWSGRRAFWGLSKASTVTPEARKLLAGLIRRITAR